MKWKLCSRRMRRESPQCRLSWFVEEGCDGCFEEITEEGARWCVGACQVPDVAVEMACAD